MAARMPRDREFERSWLESIKGRAGLPEASEFVERVLERLDDDGPDLLVEPPPVYLEVLHGYTLDLAAGAVLATQALAAQAEEVDADRLDVAMEITVLLRVLAAAAAELSQLIDPAPAA